MEVFFHKYGPLRNAFLHKVDAIANPEDRLRLYKQAGNAGYFVDIAKFALIAFMRPAHPDAHDSLTDGGEGRAWHAGGPATERRNDGTRQ